jgi:hypothetical protein
MCDPDADRGSGRTVLSGEFTNTLANFFAVNAVYVF